MDALTKDCRTMRRSARRLLLAAAAAFSALGCRSPCDQVERELHARENELLAARDELERCHAINEGLQTELQALHGDPSPARLAAATSPLSRPGPFARSPWADRPAAATATLPAATRRLQVVVEPRDADNQTIKVPGALIQALGNHSHRRERISFHLADLRDELRGPGTAAC